MSKEEPTVILCNRIEDAPVPNIKGATRDSCVRCEAPIWVSPSTRVILEEGLDRGEDWWGVHCIQCGMELAELDEEEQDDVMKIVIHAAQLTELKENLPGVGEVPEEGQHQDHDQHDPDRVTAAAVAEDGPNQ